MKNPFRASKVGTRRSQADIVASLQRRMHNEDYWFTLKANGNRMRIGVHSKGIGSLLTFSGTCYITYRIDSDRAFVSFQLLPSIFDAIFFVVIVLLMIPWSGKITDKPWLAAPEMSPWIVVFPISALVCVKLWDAFDARSEVTRLVVSATNENGA